MKLKFDNKISFIATFIALLALFLSVLDHCENRKHAKKTVKPILIIEKQEFQDEYGIFISNQGYGPAIIDSCEIFYNKKKIINSKDIWMDIFKKHFKTPINFTILNSCCINGLVIKIGEEKLLWGSKIIEIRGDKQLLDNSIEKISIIVYYHSIYDENSIANFNPILYGAQYL